jgi:hypothetical protein
LYSKLEKAMDFLKIPDSPELPRMEMDTVPDTEIPAQLGAALDLDDFSDEDNNDDSNTHKNTDTELKIDTSLKPINNFQQFEHSDSLPSTPDTFNNRNILACSIPKDKNYVTPMEDFSDPIKPPIDLINPFGANSTLSSSDPIPISLNKRLSVRRLSDLQEQKLGDYIDEKLMNIQKGFVKYLSSKTENLHEGYEWNELVNKLDDIIEFVWYAIAQVKGIPVVYHSNVMTDTSFEVIFGDKFNEIIAKIDNVIKKSSLLLVKDEENELRQLNLPDNINNSVYVSYLIKICGDLIDYIVKYELNEFSDWIILLRLFGKLDNILSIVIDYSSLKKITIISTTEKIRIASIIQRTKIALIELFDHFVRKLGIENIQTYRSAIDAFQMYVGETYEGLVDRTSL